MNNKLFGTDGVRGKAGTFPMNIEFAFNLASVLSDFACKTKKKVAIGKDTRISGDMLESALCAGFLAKGIDVIRLGVVPTPLVTLKTKSLDVDLAVMITASHNPYFDNGFKLIDSNGDKFPDEFYRNVESKLDELDKTQSNNSESIGKIIKNEAVVEEYIEHIRNIAPNYKALQGLRVVLDCANGAYSYILPQVFKDLGAGVIAINNTPDGYNINKECGSQHPEGLAKTVVESKANFGIAVDGDGDRVILVDNKGNIIDGDQLLCFLANYLKKHDLLKNNTVISTEWSNLGLGEYLTSNGYNYFKSKVGERYVIDLMNEKEAVLGGELVGHIVLSQYAKSGDGAICALIISLAYLEDGRMMDEIFPIFTPYPCVIENIRFSNNEFMRQSVEYDDVKEALKKAKDDLGNDSNLIARKSGTEPVIKLRVEGVDAKKVTEIAENLKSLILKYKK
ncbi:MAG: phosphoglucosamine mutase [Alphaproteobacteria bacterium]|nr:phosphoglucosamine mutase [Alphaproteobacteria bacterium]